MGPSWANLGPKRAPDGPDWGPFGNAAWVVNSHPFWGEGVSTLGWPRALSKRQVISEGKPTRMRRLCLKTSEATGRGGLGITSSSDALTLPVLGIECTKPPRPRCE